MRRTDRAAWRRMPGRGGIARVLGVLVLVGAAAVTFAVTSTSACAAAGFPSTGGLPSGTRFYLDPYAPPANWDHSNPDDPREPAIAARITAVPEGAWFAQYDPATITRQVERITRGAAATGTMPILVLYDVPRVNCSTNYPNAAPDVADYEAWADAFAAGLGTREALVLVEPDGLSLQNCLSATEVAGRDAAIAYAGTAVHRADPAAKVYFDAGNSAWNPASVQAAHLEAAHVTTSADGIFSNVSNFQTTGAELAYDKRVLADLGNPPKLHIVIDTSRNGNGPGSTWCDPSGRALGQLPTVDTGDPLVDAYLWVKGPGQSDGCADQGGVFDPSLAYALIANGPGGAGALAAVSKPPAVRTTPAPTAAAPTRGAAASSTPTSLPPVGCGARG